jgi:hypothetical protein
MNTLKEKLLRLTGLRYKNLPMLMENMRIMTSINDPVSQLIRCHLITEAVLDELIELAFYPNGAAITSADLTYAKKLQICSSSVLHEGFPLLPDFIVGSLRKLNSLRNRMAHKLGATVSVGEVMELFVGEEQLIPISPEEEKINIVIYHYTSFIFGNLLPKYESCGEA